MPKFTNTTYKKTITNLLEAAKDKLQNPYYMYSDKNATVVDYYSTNKEMSTLDEGSKLHYANLGENSPFKYNVIREFVIYGIDQISVSLDDDDDEGLKTGEVSGEAIVLPNTIVPVPGDYFTIPYLEEDALFKVTETSFDTMENGQNIWKFNYVMQYLNSSYKETLEKQVEKEFRYLTTTSGTEFKTIILQTDYNILEELEKLIDKLTLYYKKLFFNDKVQTFTFKENDANFYDPYFIEFLIRNKVFDYTDIYTYVTHQAYNENIFCINYDKSFFNYLEDKEQSKFKGEYVYAYCPQIDDPNSLFSTRPTPFYRIDYFSKMPFALKQMCPIDNDIIERMKSGDLYDKDDPRYVCNLWIYYMQSDDDDFLDPETMDELKYYNYTDNKLCFYAMAVNIFLLTKYIKNVLL